MNLDIFWQVALISIFYLIVFFVYNVNIENDHKSHDIMNNKNSVYYISKKYFNIYDMERKSEWDDLSVCLFVSVHHGSQGYISAVINNYNIFWPSNIGKKIIFLDKNTEYLESYVTDNWEIYYEEYDVNGLARRQYSSYIAHKYCSPNKFIAFMDCDSIFTMKVAKYMLFDEMNKPYFLYTKNIRYREWNPSYILKMRLSSWGDGMITFPVLVKTKHIESLYNYLITTHHTSLENIITKYYSSQFCVFVEYVKHFYKDEYHFALYEEQPIQRCGLHIPYAYNITSFDVRGKTKLFEFNSVINSITYDGICSVLIDKYPHKCSKFNKEAFYYRFYIIDDFKYSLPSNSKDDFVKYEKYKKDILTTVDKKAVFTYK